MIDMTPIEESLKARLLNHVTQFNIDKLLTGYITNLTKDVERVADAILGIDRTWVHWKMDSKGAIPSMITEQVETRLNEILKPVLDEAIEKALS